jgi:hypothetical protein
VVQSLPTVRKPRPWRQNALSDAECELLERHFPNEYSLGMETVRAMLRALGRSECVGRDDFDRVRNYQGS